MDWLIICLLVVIIALQVFFRPRKDHSDIASELKRLLDEMQRSFERIEKNFREITGKLALIIITDQPSTRRGCVTMK